jgi:hypothetical protein
LSIKNVSLGKTGGIKINLESKSIRMMANRRLRVDAEKLGVN